jgi:RNA polymerase sigma factor (TIGR02999 family)
MVSTLCGAALSTVAHHFVVIATRFERNRVHDSAAGLTRRRRWTRPSGVAYMSRRRHLMSEVTELLRAANGGDDQASRRLFALMYEELKRLARASLRKSGGSPALDTTMLVHESFLRLAGQRGYTPADKRAFYAYVSKVMRSVVLDAVRERQARKRGGNEVFVTLTTSAAEQPLDATQIIAIDDALDALGKISPELKELVEMRYFAGLTVPQISEVSGKSVRSIERDWEKGRMLLRKLIEEA